MLVNALERTGSRDALERFSIAIEKLGPILAAILLIPSSLAIAGLGAAAGYALAQQATHSILFEVCRYLLLAVTALAIVGPLFLPAADRTNPIRLLLLPIPRSVLYVAQSSSAFGDPWNLLALPLLTCLAAGMLAGGEPLGALLSLAAGLVFIVIVVGLASLATSVLHLLVRDRRRGELIALLFIIIIPVVSMLPAMLDPGSRRSRGGAAQPHTAVPSWLSATATRALAVVPSQIYIAATGNAAARRYPAAAAQIGMLATMALVLHGLGAAAFKRVLDSPGSSGARRGGSMPGAWSRRIPGLSSGASAVALAQLRLALRTPRGRSIMLSPLIMFLVFGAMMYRGSGTMDFGHIRFGGGLSLAMFASAMSLLSMLPIAMNQFAVDGAGLTMGLLSPLTDADMLRGKAVGNGLIIVGPCLFSIGLSYLVFGGGSPALWASIPLGLISIYLLVAPVAAITSAMFPKVVDLNSIGRGSNAHGASGLAGLLSFVVAGAPPVLLALLATRIFHRTAFAPLFIAAWCVVAYGIGRLMFVAARRIFQTRRENLALL